MFERLIHLVTLASSLSIIAGIYMVTLQMEEQEKARISAKLDAEMQTISAAVMGIETFYEVLHRIETNGDVTSEDRFRANYYFEHLLVSFSRPTIPNEKIRNILACINLDNETGRLWLAYSAKSNPDYYRPWLDAYNQGCDEVLSSKGYYEGIGI